MAIESYTETTISNFIDGQFMSPYSGQYIDSYNPAKAKVHARIPDSTREDIEKAVLSADSAFEAWSKTPRVARSAILYKIADFIEERIDEFALAESRDQGKPVWYARQVDISRSAYNFRYFAGQILHQHEILNKLDSGPVTATNYSLRQPIGVAGLIVPWNLPLYLLTWKIAPCIAFGNTCVCKPSEFTSLTAFLLCTVLQDAGLPNGVVNMVFGTGPNAGQALVEHPRVPLISFTGGTLTGKKINQTAATMFKKVSLEMGGKNANIIFNDCDFERCIETSIRSSFWNQGEICLCGSRILVHREIYDRFLSAFLNGVKKLKVGDPLDSETHLGALISQQHMEKVLNYIDIARTEGGIIECGGEKVEVVGYERGWFVKPTVITGLAPTSRLFQEEIFGPVVTVHPFETEEQAIALANDSHYGLACSIWTENGRRARRVAEKVKVGYCWVNCWMVRDLGMPFGGVKGSGIGREGGEFSWDFYTENKTICLAD